MPEANDTAIALADAGGRLAEIEAVMRTDITTYWREGLDKEHRTLLAGGVAAKPSGSSSSSDRLAEIERVMKTDIDRYFRDGLDREHAALAAAATIDPVDAPLIEDLNGSREGQELVRRWSALGTTTDAVTEVKDTAFAIAAEAGGDVIDAFDLLPDRVRVNALAALTSPVASGTAGADAVSRFQADPVGAKLAAEWGRDAPARIGRVQAVAAQMFAGLSPVEKDQARRFIDGLSPAAISAVVRRLSL